MRSLLVGIGIGIGVAIAAVTVGGVVGFRAYVDGAVTAALKDTEQLNTAAQLSPSPVVATSSPVPTQPEVIEAYSNTHQISIPSTVPFGALSYCEQLDAIAKAGGSVSDYILGSADPNGYIWATRSECSWHRDQGNIAYNVLNPSPIVVERPVVIQERVINTSGSATTSVPETNQRWNNCNGIQEPGESFSADCYERQTGRRPNLGYDSN